MSVESKSSYIFKHFVILLDGAELVFRLGLKAKSDIG